MVWNLIGKSKMNSSAKPPKRQIVKQTQMDNSGNIAWWHEFTYDRKSHKDSVSHYGTDGNLIKTLI